VGKPPRYYGFVLSPLRFTQIRASSPKHCVCDPAQIFLTSKFSYDVFFGNPLNKTETGTAYMWELLIANHLDESLQLANKKQR